MESVLAHAIPTPAMESSSRYLLWIMATESRPKAPATRQMPCVRRRDNASAMGCRAKEKTKQTADHAARVGDIARAMGCRAKEKTKQPAEYIPKQSAPHCTPSL